MNLTLLHKRGLAFLRSRPQLQKRILAGGFWAALVKGFSMPLNLVVVALLARLLSPEDMGVYFLAFSLVTAASSLGMLGMGDTMVRLVASALAIRDTSSARKAIQQSFMWGGAGALIATVGVTFFGISSGLAVSVAILVGLWGMAQTGQNLLAEALRSFSDIRSATIFQNRSISNAIIAVILFSLWILEVRIDLIYVFGALVVVTVTADVLGLLFLRWKMNNEAPAASSRDADEVPPLRLLSQALPVFGITSMNMIKAQVGIWIVATLLTNEEVALYGSANRLVYLVSVPLSTVVNALIPPIIAEMYARNQIAKLERTVRRLATFATIAASLITVILVAGGKVILSVVFGDFYTGAWLVLGLLALAQLIGVAGGSCGVTLVMTGHQRRLLGITTVSALLAVVFTFAGARMMGIVGVAGAMVLAVLVQNVLMVLGTRDAVGIWTHVKLSLR